MELFHALHDLSLTRGGEPALIDDAGTLTWAETKTAVERVCLGLVHAGMRRAKSVALLTTRSRHQAIAFLAVARGGGIALPLAPLAGAERLQAVLETSQPSLLIYEECYAEFAAEAIRRGAFRGVIRIGGEPGPGEIPWSRLEKTDAEGARFPVLEENAVVLHHYAVDASLSLRAGLGDLRTLWAAARAALRGLRMREGARFLPCFSGGLCAHEPILRALRTGGCAIFVRNLHPREVIAAARRHGADCIMAPASYYHVLCDQAAAEPPGWTTPPALEARGHVPLGLRARAKRLLGAELLPTWSAAESLGPALGASPTGFGAPATPLMAFPGFKDRIVNQIGKETPEGSPGELLIGGEGMATAVLGPDGRARAALDSAGFLRTGLIAARLSSGEIRILGTRFDVMLRDGQRICTGIPALAAEACPGVREAEAMVIDQGGDRLVLALAILPEPGVRLEESFLLEEIARRCKPAEVPDEAHMLPALPRLPDGAVDRQRLGEELRKRIC